MSEEIKDNITPEPTEEITGEKAEEPQKVKDETVETEEEHPETAKKPENPR